VERDEALPRKRQGAGRSGKGRLGHWRQATSGSPDCTWLGQFERACVTRRRGSAWNRGPVPARCRGPTISAPRHQARAGSQQNNHSTNLLQAWTQSKPGTPHNEEIFLGAIPALPAHAPPEPHSALSTSTVPLVKSLPARGLRFEASGACPGRERPACDRRLGERGAPGGLSAHYKTAARARRGLPRRSTPGLFQRVCVCVWRAPPTPARCARPRFQT
jgi:hypothetical protein